MIKNNEHLEKSFCNILVIRDEIKIVKSHKNAGHLGAENVSFQNNFEVNWF